MKVPVSMLKGGGSSKAAALLAVLAGLAIVAAMKSQPKAQTAPPRN